MYKVRKTAVKWPNSILMAPDPPIRHNLMSLTNTHHFQLTRPLISTGAARGGLKTCISVFAWELQWEISFGGVQILPIGLRTPFCSFPVRPGQYALNALGLTPVGPTVREWEPKSVCINATFPLQAPKLHAFRPLARPSLGRSARRKVLLVSTSLLLLAMPISSMSGHKLKKITCSTIWTCLQTVKKHVFLVPICCLWLKSPGNMYLFLCRSQIHTTCS